MDRILLIEDDDSLRAVVTAFLEREGFTVDAFPSAEGALGGSTLANYSCILSDFKLPGMNGLTLLERVREQSRAVPFIIMTAFGSIDIAVRAMRAGANDFISKPFEPEILSTVVREVIEHRRIVNRSGLARGRAHRAFLTESPRTVELLRDARKVARVNTSVLILGESGTGKELIARFIHEQSPRHDRPFVAVNCGAIPADLLESELFGHEAGSFTGATQTRLGLFELAADGTIFLDEIGDMPPPLQVKLLRALQEREIKRVGGTKTIVAAPRIIAATNHYIDRALSEKTLREDLYYRVAVVTLTIPPLRERAEDIELLSHHYTEAFCAAIGRATLAIDAAAQAALRGYGWPGNARELENVIERAVILAGDAIRLEHLGIAPARSTMVAETSLSLPDVASRAAREAEIELIVKVLGETNGNKTKAALKLGVSYKTLLNKIRDYGLEGRGVSSKTEASYTDGTQSSPSTLGVEKI